ncbi:MAG: hypothetical protein LUI87_08850 [Lachnospiraceae bacterium]|nr:hypothetical protein [Lachnospiraceae bacterium]
MRDNRLSFYKRNRLIIWAIICSITAALIIQILFSINAPCDFLVAKWSAGDILSYIGTVSLGVIALWQNSTFQEENEKSQERLKDIALRANELVLTSKIVEYESENLKELKVNLIEFSEACDPQTFGILLANNDDDSQKLVISAQLEQRIDKSFMALGRSLRIDSEIKKNDESSLKNMYAVLYAEAKNILGKFRDDPSRDMASDLAVMAKIRDDFWKEREAYLVSREQKLRKLLYGDLSLAEISELYNESDVTEEQSNG